MNLFNTTAYKTFNYSIAELEIGLDEITSLLRFSDNVPPEIIETITNELKRFSNIDGIIGGYVIKNASFDKANFQIQIDEQRFNVGKSIWNFLKQADKIAIFTCTAGAEISNRSKELMANGMLLEGYVVDVIGTVVVEKAMDKIHNHLKADFEAINQSVSNRYSPGYCAWEVKEQHKLFSFFPKNICGIEINASALMIPTKSVSGFIGIGENIKFRNYTCDTCTSVNCIYRGLK